MHERIMRLVFVGLVLANIVLAMGAGLKRDAVGTTGGSAAHGKSGGADPDAGLLVLVGEEAGDLSESSNARASDRGYSAGVGTLPTSSYGIEEYTATPAQISRQDIPAAVSDPAASDRAVTISALEGRRTDSEGGSFVRAQSPGPESVAVSDPMELQRQGTATASSAEDAAGTGEQAHNSDVAKQQVLSCVRIGPFAHRPDASRLLAGLGETISVGDSYEEEVADKPIFWVHVPPFGGTREARNAQQDLSGRGIESFVISDLGPLHNGISLGVFRDPDSAQRLAKAREVVGYPVAIHESQRKRVVHFVRTRVPTEDAERLVVMLASRAGTVSGEATAALVECDEGFNSRVAGATGRR